jgi:hypothetical protein
MTFFYFYAFVMLIAAAPIVFGRRVVWNRLVVPAAA